jgi:hypothetical protein
MDRKRKTWVNDAINLNSRQVLPFRMSVLIPQLMSLSALAILMGAIIRIKARMITRAIDVIVFTPPRLLSPTPGFISRMRRARTPDGKNDERPEMKRMAVNSLFDSVFDISFRKFNIRIGQQS